MIYKKNFTHLWTTKMSLGSNSTAIKSILDALFYFLILLLSKAEKIQSETANDPGQNISTFVENFTSSLDQTLFDFSLLENLSDTTQFLAKIGEYAADATQFTTIDPKNDKWLFSNYSTLFPAPKSPILLQRKIFNSDLIEEFSKIEPSNNHNEQMDKNIDKRTSKLEIDPVPNPNDDFCKSNNFGIYLSDTESSISQTNSGEKSPIIDSEEKSGTNQNDFCKTSDFPVDQVEEEGTNSDKDGDFVIDEKEYKEAEKMTKCIRKDFNKGGVVCVCNKTYCDKILPIRPLSPGKYSWYRSSPDGYRFNRLDGQLSRYTNDVKDAFNINTTLKLQKFIGFGGSFSDSASRNIESLSQLTREQLMRSYYGPFGLEYNLGKVPMGGTDFSPRFYTYMDVPQNFELSEQDLKFKIPVIRKALEMTRNNLKLIGSAWTAPKWMKTKCSEHKGELKREYYQLYADYYSLFLKNYAKNGIKFWVVSTGNKPMIPFNYTEPPFVNAMEWSPYKQSKWVNRYLVPTLKQYGFSDVELVIGDENREIIAYFVKWFFEPLVGEKYHKLKTMIVNDAYFDVSGVSIQGFSDAPDNEIYLNRTHDLYPEKFMLLVENACLGKPQLGAWNCAERYAKQLLNYFNAWTSGFVDWNLALDLDGGPNYLNLFLDAAIIIDLDKDEFYKQPVYYVIGHFSKFLPPDSVRLLVEPFNRTSTGVAAIAAQRPDKGIVIVAYNRSPQVQNAAFVIDKKYTLSLDVSAKSINSVIFWMD